MKPTKPTKPGYYWYRRSLESEWEPVEVLEKNGELLLFTRYNMANPYSVSIDTDYFNWGGQCSGFRYDPA